MNILLLDSSFNKMQAAHLVGSLTDQAEYQVLAAASTEKGAQGEKALEIIEQLATDPSASRLFAEYEYLLFNRGPGSFVGTRISTSLAQAIATVEPQVKVIAASALEMMAQQQMQLALILAQTQITNSPFNQATKIFVALDANMGEAYTAAFTWQSVSESTDLATAGAMIKLCGQEQLVKQQELATIYKFATTPDCKEREAILTQENYTSKFGFEVKDQVILVGNAWNKYYPHYSTLAHALTDEQIARPAYLALNQFCQKHFVKPQMRGQRRVDVVTDIPDDIFALFEELTSLPDLRFQASLVAQKISAQDFTARLDIEPVYIRDKVTY